MRPTSLPWSTTSSRPLSTAAICRIASDDAGAGGNLDCLVGGPHNLADAPARALGRGTLAHLRQRHDTQHLSIHRERKAAKIVAQEIVVRWHRLPFPGASAIDAHHNLANARAGRRLLDDHVLVARRRGAARDGPMTISHGPPTKPGREDLQRAERDQSPRDRCCPDRPPPRSRGADRPSASTTPRAAGALRRAEIRAAG